MARQIIQHEPSGERYIADYNDENRIVLLAGPFHYLELPGDAGDIEDYELSDEDAEWANDQTWHNVPS